MRKQRRLRTLFKAPLPIHTIRVGRWVHSVTHPHHGHLDPLADKVPLIHKTRQQDFKQIYEQEDGAGVDWKGTSLAYGSSKRRDESSNVTTTDLSMIYQLDNPEKWVSKAIQRQANRTWIEDALKRDGRMYMIVGYQTVHDAHIGE